VDRAPAHGAAPRAGRRACVRCEERRLTGTRPAAAARGAATKLDAGVTGLDEFINSIGGASADGLPIGGVGEVTQVLAAAPQVLDGLDPQDGIPGGPTLPDPLGGVTAPTLPPVLPG
jgi:hypothetical protein